MATWRIFEVGSGGFIFARHYRKEWAENCMMQLMVVDLDAWWAHIASLDLAGKFMRRRRSRRRCFDPGDFASRT